jgi:hypothetical protein
MPFAATARQAEQHRRLEDIDREVQRRIGLEMGDETEDQHVIEAAVAAQALAALNQMLRQSIGACLGTHWAIARTLSPAADMGIAARHPASRRTRQRVIDLTSTLGRRIDHYALLADAPELLTLQFGVRQLGVSCVVCPYFTSSVAAAPTTCPAAQAIATTRASHSATSEPIEGVVIDVCEEEA